MFLEKLFHLKSSVLFFIIAVRIPPTLCGFLVTPDCVRKHIMHNSCLIPELFEYH